MKVLEPYDLKQNNIANTEVCDSSKILYDATVDEMRIMPIEFIEIYHDFRSVANTACAST